MEGTTGRYRPRSESPVNVEGQNLNDFEVKIAPEETNGAPFANGKHVGAGEDSPESVDER